MLIGVQKLIGEDVPEERTGAAQGVAYLANGIAPAAVTLASGPLYEALWRLWHRADDRASRRWRPCASVGAIAQPQRAGEGGETSEPA